MIGVSNGALTYLGIDKMLLILFIVVLTPSYVLSQIESEIEYHDKSNSIEENDSTSINSDSTGVSGYDLKFQKLYYTVWNNLKNTWELRIMMLNAPGYIGKEVQDFFKPHGNEFGWIPLLEITSGIRPKFGTALYYLQGIYSSSIRGTIAGREKYKFELRSTFDGGSGEPYRWQLHANIIHRVDDDMWFYGIGKTPQTDDRSHFLDQSDEDKGKFHQRKSRFLLLAGLRTSRNIEWFGFSQYTVRKVYNPPGSSSDERDLGSVFDLTTLPGALGKNHQIYNELMFRYDSRIAIWEMDAAFSLESYIGHVQGITNDNSRLLRSGFDFTAFIPTLRKDWLLVPRMVLNRVYNLDTSSEINFYDYSRHPVFRGVTSRLLYRSENYALVNSIEHRWGLNSKLTITLFHDMLFSGHDMEDFLIDDAPWAVGSSLILHGRNEELARIQLVYGTAGYKGIVKFGIPADKNHRWRWR